MRPRPGVFDLRLCPICLALLVGRPQRLAGILPGRNRKRER